MCTAITTQALTGDTYFGRTMDFSYPLSPELYIIPKGYVWTNLLNTHKITNQYKIMGIGQDISPVTLADGVNEMGFAAAVLYFPGYAQYEADTQQTLTRLPIAAIELVNFLLGQCATVEQAVSFLPMLQIVGVQDSVTNTVAPLHWIIADKSGACVTVEKTADGLNIMENMIGVLSNSPDFQWHMTNLRNYMNVSPCQQQEIAWDSVILTPFGQGTGTVGLPGDFTPPSRFVRTAYLKSHTPLPNNLEEAVNTCFHILDSVSIPKGAVMTDRHTADYTQYTSFINLNSGEYFFKTYENNQIARARMMKGMGDGSGMVSLGKLHRPIVFDEWLKSDFFTIVRDNTETDTRLETTDM